MSWIEITVVIVGLALIAAKPCARKLALMLGLVFLISFSWLSLAHIPPKQAKALKSDHELAQAHSQTDSNTKQISTEKMWQHFNRSRIKLDDEAKADKAKQDATEEIDLTESEEPEQTRPAWVDLSPKRIGNVYRVVVSAGPYKDETECYHALEPLLNKVVKNRIEQLEPGSQVPELEQLGLGVDYILRDLCDQAWVETSEASFGEMKQVHVQMQFGAAQDKQLRTAFRDYQRQTRVAKVGGIAGLGIGGLALLYGLLKIVPGREAAT